MGLLAFSLGACAEAPLPQSQLRADDCLRGLDLAHLDQQIKRCNAVVAAFPKRPGPLNDRYLLRSLAGDDRGACRDIALAQALSSRHGAGSPDQDLLEEIRVRHSACQRPPRRIMPPASGPATPAP